jgi:uncharacterized protein YjbJ (UPF0337 family)
MKASTTNKSRGAANIVKGKSKEIAGKVVRSPRLQAKGAAQKTVGQIQRSIGQRQKVRGE